MNADAPGGTTTRVRVRRVRLALPRGALPPGDSGRAQALARAAAAAIGAAAERGALSDTAHVAVALPRAPGEPAAAFAQRLRAALAPNGGAGVRQGFDPEGR